MRGHYHAFWYLDCEDTINEKCCGDKYIVSFDDKLKQQVINMKQIKTFQPSAGTFSPRTEIYLWGTNEVDNNIWQKIVLI